MAQRVQDLSKFVLPPNFRGREAWFVQLWWIVQGVLFHTSPQALYVWRRDRQGRAYKAIGQHNLSLEAEHWRQELGRRPRNTLLIGRNHDWRKCRSLPAFVSMRGFSRLHASVIRHIPESDSR